jgi:hypothetical protein
MSRSSSTTMMRGRLVADGSRRASDGVGPFTRVCCHRTPSRVLSIGRQARQAQQALNGSAVALFPKLMRCARLVPERVKRLVCQISNGACFGGSVF